MPRLAEQWSEVVRLEFEADVLARRIPAPSVIMHTGRGLAALWLIHEQPRRVLPRWQACMDALIELYAPFGADRACSDSARVFRIPGSHHARTGRRVRVIGGTDQRHSFDDLADRIFAAAGRPPRDELKNRRAERSARSNGQQPPRGLPPAVRFRQVLRDLERLRQAWGGEVPEGQRNTWLHLYATCLTHTSESHEIEPAVQAMAAVATPGLSVAEVRAVARSAVRRAEAARSADPRTDGRLHYAGAEIADRLGIADGAARALGLEQVYSQEERKRRKTERERERRAIDGAQSREAYLAANDISRTKPWEAENISRQTWYCHRKAERAKAAKGSGTPSSA